MSMPNVLSVGGHSRELAAEHVVEALFTTVGCRLEPQGRGTRFPVMEDLCAGYLAAGRALEALRELQEIETGLRQIPVRDVVWSLAQFRRDDANEPVNRQAGNVLEYFVAAGGQPLISALREGLQECLRTGQALRLTYRKQARDGIVSGLCLAFAGAAWMFVGRTFFPQWCLAPIYDHDATIPIWTFGMDLVMLGAGFAVAQMSPAVSDWFRRHQRALISLAIFMPIAWLVVCWRAGLFNV